VTVQNQFKVFAGADGAFALTPAAYAAMTALQQGFQNGVADAEEFNALGRQVSTVAAMIGQFIVDKANLDANDNGNVAELENRFIAALIEVIREVGGVNVTHFAETDTGTANAVVTVSNPVIDVYAKPCIVLFKKGPSDNSAAITANFGAGVKSLVDQTGADFASAALKANSYYLCMYDGTKFRVLGGSVSYTNVTGLTANSGKMIHFNGTTGVIDLDISTGNHDASPASADMWPREKASNGDQVQMTTDELITWIKNVINHGPGTNPGQFIVQVMSISSMGNPYTAGFRVGDVHTASNIQGASWPGVTGVSGIMGIDSANTGLQAANFHPPHTGSVDGTIAGNWKLKHWFWLGSAAYIDYYFALIWVREP